jgi:hypothetical protein
MEIEEPINSHEQNLIRRFPSTTIRNRIRKFFGLPKSIHGEYIDNERCSWRMFNYRKYSINSLLFF